MKPHSLSVVVFTSRETADDLLSTLQSVRQGIVQPMVVDVMVNGNLELAQSLLRLAHRDLSMKGIRIWHTPFGDKAHAWNEYVHRVWDGVSPALNLDGYVKLLPGATGALQHALRDSPDALAATGVPSVGRSASTTARAMVRDGGLHGNFFLLSSHAMARFRGMQVRLPVGLYRTDAVIGAMLAFGMDPSVHAWDPLRRIVVVPHATWLTNEKSVLSPAEWRTHVKRLVRQGQGMLENQAVRQHLAVLKRPPRELPNHVRQLVMQWGHHNGSRRRRLFVRHPTSWLAWRRLLTTSNSDSTPPSMLLIGTVGDS